MKFFFDRLTKLSQGAKRKYILYSLAIPLGCFILAYFLESFNGRFFNKMVGFLEVLVVFGFFLFWIILRLILWVEDGYKK
jgi:hypothetical protein